MVASSWSGRNVCVFDDICDVFSLINIAVYSSYLREIIFHNVCNSNMLVDPQVYLVFYPFINCHLDIT